MVGEGKPPDWLVHVRCTKQRQTRREERRSEGKRIKEEYKDEGGGRDQEGCMSCGCVYMYVCVEVGMEGK